MSEHQKRYIDNGTEFYYLMGDQPTTCSICGTRTSFEELHGALQEHQCLNPSCGYVFFVIDEDPE